MQYFLFADIHTNLDALVACLTDYILRFKPSIRTRDRIIRTLQRQDIPTEKIESAETGSGTERIVFLGDVVGYGVDVDECTGITFDLADEMVLGNHEVSVCDQKHPVNNSTGNKEVFEQWNWTRKQLSPENLARLMDLYRQQIYLAQEGEFVFSHGLPWPGDGFHYYSEPEDLGFIFYKPEFKGKIIFTGHSHTPLVQGIDLKSGLNPYDSVLLIEKAKPEEITLNSIETVFSLANWENIFVSIPSVGQPRDGCPFAGYAVYDLNTKELTFRRVSYDVDLVTEKIDARDEEIFGRLLGFYGNRLKMGK